MNLLQNYSEKHQEIMDEAAGIVKLLDTGTADTNEIRRILSILAGKLKVHLAAEDRYLYPKLMASENDRVRTTAENFVKEMGGIYSSFSDFLTRWPSGSTIGENRELFRSEMKEVVAALSERISREDSELYPLAIEQG